MDHDVAGEVDTGGLEHALFTQVLGHTREVDAASIPPREEKKRPFLCASLVLPSLLALLLKPEGDPVRKLCSTTNFRLLRNCRRRFTIRQIVRKPKSRTVRSGAELLDQADVCEIRADVRRARMKRS